MNAKEIAQRAVIIVLWLIAIFAMVYLLTGCIDVVRDDDNRRGGFVVEADCDDNTVSVDFELNQDKAVKRTEVKK